MFINIEGPFTTWRQSKDMHVSYLACYFTNFGNSNYYVFLCICFVLCSNFCEDNPFYLLFFIACLWNSILINMCIRYYSVCFECNQLLFFDVFSDIKYLNETNVIELISRCKGADPLKDNDELLCALYQVYSSPEALGNSFIKRSQGSKKNIFKLHNHPKTASPNMTKEEVSIIAFYFIVN